MFRDYEANSQCWSPKIGCVHSMPQAIVHGPLEWAGLNVPNLYTEQLTTQLTILLCHSLRMDETTRILIRALAEAMQLEMGLAGKVMETPGVFKPVITDTWLKWLWLDCLCYDLHIQMDIQKLQPNCSNDMELMQAFIQHGYRGQELCDLNWCHMFLQVIWVSDICDGTGKEILMEAWEGQQPMDLPFHWPMTVVA